MISWSCFNCHCIIPASREKIWDVYLPPIPFIIRHFYLAPLELISNGGWGWFSEDEWIQLEDEVFISAGHISWFLLLTSCQNVPGYYSRSLYRPFARTLGSLSYFCQPHYLAAINLETRGWDDFSITTQYCTILHVICFSFLSSHSNRVYPITKLQKSFSTLFISNCVTNGLGNGISINHKLHKLHCYKYQLNNAQMVNPTMLSVNVWIKPSPAASQFDSALLVSDSDHFQQKLPVLFPWLVSCY